MNIEIIRGAIGSGKSFYIFNSIERELKTSKRKQLIVVPEQFSYETERLAAERFGGTGLNNVEAVTLSRLVSRHLENRIKNRLTKSGKMMIVYKALSSLPDGSLFYGCAKKAGFLTSCADILSEFSEYMITPNILRKNAERAENKLLSEKLFAAADIYEEYLRLLDGRFFDSEQDLLALSEYAEKSKAFSECDFWFDEFSVFLPQHYCLMRSLLRCGSRIHISVCIDSAERELYEANLLIINKLRRLAEDMSLEICEYRTDDVVRSVKSAELLFLSENIDKTDFPDTKPWEDKTNDISLFVCKDLYREVRRSALLIRKLVMENNYRFRDISVVLANSEAYSHIIQAVFADLDIPYFSDTRLCVAEHPISTLLISVFDILSDSWSYTSLFRFLRTGFFFTKDENDEVTSLDPDAVDLLENYVLKYGIRGKGVWLDDEKWQRSQNGFFDSLLDDSAPFSPSELEKINTLRLVLIAPFKKLYSAISGRRTVYEFAQAVFEFLKDICLYEGIIKKCEEFDREGFRNEAEQFRQIWNIILEVLNQCVVVAGSEKCSREAFSGMLVAGLSAVDISIIPSGLDRVSVSNLQRSRQHNARVLLILGSVYGAIPPENTANGIFTDSDRTHLRELLARDGLEIAAESEIRNITDKFNFFSMLFTASEKVFFSYPAADSEANTMRPAAFISELFKLFPNLSSGDDIICENTEDYIYSPRTAYQYMLSQSNKKDGFGGAVYAWYEKNRPEKLEVINQAAHYKREDAHILPENAERLYSDRSGYSISRLNDYGGCPFSYFVKHGLKAKNQEIRQIRKFDLGSIMHLALEMYCNRIDSGCESFEELRNNWLSLTDEQSDKICTEIMQTLEEKILYGVIRDENKLRYIIMRIGKIVNQTINSIRKSLVSGEYAAVCYEQKFRVNVIWDNKSVPINGIIDRIDLAELTEEKIAELRIADYKTGKKKFSVVSICNKQDIQLIMYAVAAVEMYRSGIIKYAKPDYEPHMRAVLYNRMHDDLTEGQSIDAAKTAQVFASRPDGLLVLDENDTGILDAASALRMDKALLPSSESEFFRLKLNKNGTVAAASQVTSESAFGLLCDYVKKSVIEADGEILDGIIKIYPACSKDHSACDWCDFGEICLYNKKFDSSRTLVEKDDEAWDIIKKEVQKDD